MEKGDHHISLYGGFEPAVFFHPDIIGGSGWENCWSAAFQMADGTYLRPYRFTKTSKGFGFQVVTDDSTPKWKFKTHLFADLICGGVRPVFWEPRQDAVHLRKSSNVFIRRKVRSQGANF
jgi:hypothetical protein